MSNLDQYILGNGALYGRLCIVTEVLGKFVSSAPYAVSLAQLERQTGLAAKELTRLCNMLCREQLLKPDPQQAQSWLLACETSQVTLEDAFRCVVAERSARARPGRHKAGAEYGEENQRDSARHDVDLLVMQAAMSINQTVFQHLRQFSLDRLKVSASGMFTSRRDSIAWPPRKLSFT